jgi:hypothetical protein
MRVEQRIGRIDRLGQTYSEIRIINLQYEDTVEATVHRVLRTRIGMFVGVVGKLQPILSKIAGQIARAVLVQDADDATEAVVEGIQSGVAQADETAFDLDSLLTGDAIEGIAVPALYDLGDLGRILRDHKRLIPEAEVSHRSEKEVFYQVQGMNSQERVTVSPEYYQDHLEDLELWSPGNPLFPRTGSESPVVGEDVPLADLLKT